MNSGQQEVVFKDPFANQPWGDNQDNGLNVDYCVGYIFIDGKYKMIQNIVYFWSYQEALNLLHFHSQAYKTIYNEPEVFDTELGPVHLWAEQKIVLSLLTDRFALKIVKFEPSMSKDDYTIYAFFNAIEYY